MPFRLLVVLLIVLAGPPGTGPARARNPDAADITGKEATTPSMPGETFGTEVTLPKRKIIYLNGHTTWDNVFDALVRAFRRLDAYLKKAGIKPEGPAMTIYIETNDSGFKFRAARPIAEMPASPPKGDIAVGEAPAGKALEFVYSGTYSEIDATYEAITDYLDDKGFEAKDEFIEEYASGLAAGPDNDNMVINIFIPVK